MGEENNVSKQTIHIEFHSCQYKRLIKMICFLINYSFQRWIIWIVLFFVAIFVGNFVFKWIIKKRARKKRENMTSRVNLIFYTGKKESIKKHSIDAYGCTKKSKREGVNRLAPLSLTHKMIDSQRKRWMKWEIEMRLHNIWVISVPLSALHFLFRTSKDPFQAPELAQLPILLKKKTDKKLGFI